MGRNGLLGALRCLPDAQGIAPRTAPTQEAISTHQMSHYQRPLVLDGDPALQVRRDAAGDQDPIAAVLDHQLAAARALVAKYSKD